MGVIIISNIVYKWDFIVTLYVTISESHNSSFHKVWTYCIWQI